MKIVAKNHLSFVCPINFADMQESAKRLVCDHFGRETFSLPDYTLEEANELQKRHNSICGFVRTIAIVASTAAAISSNKIPQPQSAALGGSSFSPLNFPLGIAGGLRISSNLERRRNGN